jgi:hypothetical protein
MKLEFWRQIFRKILNINFHENPSSGSRVVPCGQTEDMTEVIVAFRNFANAPKTGLWRRIFTALAAGTMIIVFCGVTLARGFWAH